MTTLSSDGPYPGVEGLNLKALASAVWRGLPLIALCVAVTTGIAVLFAARQTSVYEAYSVVHIKTTPNLAETLGAALGAAGESRTVATEIERLRLSKALQEGVAVNVLGLRDSSLTDADEQRVQALARSLPYAVGFAPHADGVNMIGIRARGTDPDLVARLANAYAEEYVARGQSLSREGAESGRDFFLSQAERQRAQLEEAEAELAAFMAQAGTVDLNQTGQAAVSSLASLDASIFEATAELRVASTRRASLERELQRVQPRLAESLSSSAPGEIEALQARIARLEIEARDYYARDPSLQGNEARSPELTSIIRRIDDARVRVRELSNRHVDQALATGGGAQSGLGYAADLQRQVAQEALKVRSLEARRSALLERRQAAQARVHSIPAQQVRLAELERAQATAEQSYSLLMDQARAATFAGESDLELAEIVREADTPRWPVAPNRSQTILLGGLLGLFFGLGVTLVRHSTDLRVWTPEDVRTGGYRLLGTIPNFRSVLKGAFDTEPYVEIEGREVSSLVVMGMDPQSLVTEAFRHLRASIGFWLRERGESVRVVLVTSPGPGEGKSMAAMGLAISLAQAGMRTLYIDADLRKPSAHRMVGVERGEGLGSLLARGGRLDWESYRRPLHVTWRSADYALDRLYVLPAGDPVPNPTELLASDMFPAVIQSARQRFDAVVVDSSPVLPVPDALHAAASCDLVVLMADTGVTSVSALTHAREALQRVRPADPAPVGVVLNRAADRGAAGYGYGYGYEDLSPAKFEPTLSSGDGAILSAAPVSESDAGTPHAGREA